MKRRSFLKTTLLGAGSLLVGVRCSSETDADVDLGSAFSPVAGDVFFPQSVASGDPKADSVILWTRVVDATTSGDLSLTLEVARDAGFTKLVKLDGKASLKVSALAKFDGCIKVRVENLESAKDYHYRFLY